MPKRGMSWRHVIINTKNTWLHGDERGFRSRKHRIHSSGDYRNPPPKGEHRALHEYQLERAGEEVTIPQELRARIGQALLTYLRNQNHCVLALAVAKVHAHAVVELPTARSTVKRIIGEAKRGASRAVTSELSG